ncbi:P27 family phage terminase small subunit [Fusibacter sp. JL298sf-3]
MGRKTKNELLREKIKEAIIAQLKDKNLDANTHYKNLVDDYMTFWDIKNMLAKDIKKRGVAIEWDNGGGQKGVKKNESVAELLKVNGQMLKILNDLGIKAAEFEVKDPEDDTL